MMERKPTLCVVAGPNGSGKTTTTVQLLNNEWAADSLYINPDNIAQEMFGDWNSPEAVMKAAEYATNLRYLCLEQKRDFVFETVFSSEEKLEFLQKAKEPFALCIIHIFRGRKPILQVSCKCCQSNNICRSSLYI